VVHTAVDLRLLAILTASDGSGWRKQTRRFRSRRQQLNRRRRAAEDSNGRRTGSRDTNSRFGMIAKCELRNLFGIE